MQKQRDGVLYVHDYNIDLVDNQIFLMGEEMIPDVDDHLNEPGVEYRMSNRFIRNLMLAKQVNPDKTLLVHMKTAGGSWVEGMAIYDAIKAYPYPLVILSYTHARSMSSLILQAADKRVLMPNSYFMFHDGTDAIDGTQKSVRSYVEFGKSNTKTMLSIYAEAMFAKGLMKDVPITKIHSWLRRQMDKKEEVYLTAQQAVDYGLADEIFDGDWKRLRETE